MTRRNALGPDITMDVMGPGQVFGLLGTLDGQGCPLTAIALTDVALLKAPKHEFLDIYQQNHILKDQLLKRTSARMHQKLDLMAKMVSGAVEERIAAILVILAESYGDQRDRNDIEIDLPLTRKEIAEMAATTTETTIRVFSRWSKQGLVSTRRQRIRIENFERLKQI